MPDGIGKLKDKARDRFPRTSHFVERYHTTLSAIAISFLVAYVAYVGILEHATENTVTHIKGDVSVIKQQSSCAPRANGEPKRPKRCRESFHTIIHKILTPLEACEFLEHGAPVIRIGGKPIPKVTCVEPEPQPEFSAGPPNPKNRVGNPGESATAGSGHAAPEHQSTSGNTGGGGGHHTGSTGGSHHGSGGGHHSGGGGNPAPTPEPQPEGPGASGGAGKSEESNASEHAEETPANESSAKLLPSVVGSVESTVCGAPVAGKIVCE